MNNYVELMDFNVLVMMASERGSKAFKFLVIP